MTSQNNKNHILAMLPADVLTAWQADLETMALRQGQVLYEPGQTLSHLYFPTTAIVSWVYVLENGASTEVAMTGKESVIGMYLLMGGGKSLNHALVQTAGQALRIPVARVLASFQQAHGQEVQAVFWLFTRALITQMAHVAVCHRHHSLEQQLSRMLLMTLDRSEGNTIGLTHDMLARFLGVRREGVTVAAQKLMHDGIIHYARGHITVQDRAALEQRSCECYGVIRQEYARLLPRPPACLG